MTVEELLPLLDGVRASGEGWMAKCPAHDDRTASLSIGAGRDGRILMHCFAECGPHAITSALGIELTDLFPPRIEAYAEPIRVPRHNPADILRVVHFEAAIVLAAAHVMLQGSPLSDADFRRLQESELKIHEAMKRAAA